MKKQQKRESSRWLMLDRKESEAEEAARPSSKLKLVDHDDHTYVVVISREIASISMLIISH